MAILQDAVAGVDVELVEHHDDDGGHGRAAQGSAVTGPFGDHSDVGVSIVDSGGGNEPVARDRPHSLLDRPGSGVAGFHDVVDHARSQGLGRGTSGGGVHRFLSWGTAGRLRTRQQSLAI